MDEQTRYSRRLEFSVNPAGATQRLLFDETPVIARRAPPLPVPESFYERGHAVFRNVPDATAAREVIEGLIASLDLAQAPFFGRCEGRVQLAKVDRIPVCHDIVPRSFQALHFDMGQPIVSDSTQTLYLLVALYRQPDVPEGPAFTRVVHLPTLLAQRNWPDPAEVDRRLIDYVRRYGDGWFDPRPVNTLRLACFARVLDAVTGAHALTHYVDKTTGDWFQDTRGTDGTIGLRNETAFYRRCGLELEAVEERVCLRGGELLVVDNVRAAHGRFGKRQPQEIHQFLYGVRSGTPADIDALRRSLVDAFAQAGSCESGRPKAA